MSDTIRVRYAPSPTGFLHIGNARTALFNFLYARHSDGKFIIRIEDTDAKRNIDGGEESQLENLEWLGIDWDESPRNPGNYGPYRQSERYDTYNQYVENLLESGNAYYAFDTAEELEAAREKQLENKIAPHYAGTWRDASQEDIEAARVEGRPESVRFRVPKHQSIKFDDMVKGEVAFDSDTVGGDFVIRKSDGSPTYNFAVVIDDHLMKITHILRGDDHLANTPKQIMIYEALGIDVPTFGHMTLIINAETGKKLSKRDNNALQFIEQYRERGYHPEAIFNYIAFLGWSPKGEQEIYSREELIELFDPERLSKAPASFDQEKLDWMSHHYIQEASLEEVIEHTHPALIEAGILDENADEDEVTYINKVIALYQDSMNYTAQIIELGSAFFNDEPVYTEAGKEALNGEGAATVLESFKEKLAGLSDDEFTKENIKPLIKEVQKETGIKGKNLYMPLRAALIGEAHGPGADEVVEVLGRDKSNEHIDKSLNIIE